MKKITDAIRKVLVEDSRPYGMGAWEIREKLPIEGRYLLSFDTFEKILRGYCARIPMRQSYILDENYYVKRWEKHENDLRISLARLR